MSHAVRPTTNYAVTRTSSGTPAWLRVETLGLLFLFLVITLPTSYQSIKGLLLAVLLGAVAARELTRGRLALDPAVLHRLVLFMAVGAGFVLLGVLRGTPGALALAPVYVLWPAVYCLLAAGMVNPMALHRVMRLLVVAALAIELYAASYLLYARGLLPPALYLPLDQGQAVGFYGGYVEFNLYAITSLAFLVPYVIGLLIVTPRGQQVPGGRWVVAAAAVLGVAIILLSGRRALWLVVLASPVLALIVRRDLPAAGTAVRLRTLVKTGLAAGLAAYLALTVTGVLDFSRLRLALSDAFDFSSTEGQARGPSQAAALLSGWMDDPVFGAGLGAVASGVVRSLEQPWAYELSYLALLFQVGLVGVALYAYGALWTLGQCRRVLRDGGPLAAPLAAVLVGTGSFLLANATNPYLQKFDSLWVLFLPLAVVSTWRLGLAHSRDPGPAPAAPRADSAAVSR
jgi:O-antigen ligase